MRATFPFPVRLRAAVPELAGMRFDPFTNIDGESFARPTLNGYWRLSLDVVAATTQGKLALSAFVTLMSAGNASCLVPVPVMARPNDASGRMLSGSYMAPDYASDHVGFAAGLYDGVKLRSQASHRDSYIDVSKPANTRFMPGHFISLGERLHQIVSVSSIDDAETAARLSLMPPVRGAHLAGQVVIIDQLRLLCRLETGGQIGRSIDKFKSSTLTFTEAF